MSIHGNLTPDENTDALSRFAREGYEIHGRRHDEIVEKAKARATSWGIFFGVLGAHVFHALLDLAGINL